MIPLFDSLSHPTQSGEWKDGACDASFDTYLGDYRRTACIGACAVGLPGIGAYSHEGFIERCRLHPELFPVAPLTNVSDYAREIRHIAQLGFRGLKVHHRFARIPYDEALLSEVFRLATEYGLALFYCTHYHSSSLDYPPRDPLFVLVSALKKNPAARVILTHGGTVRILEYAEIVRADARLLLDISHTLLRYSGSSLDLDIRYLCHTLDQKLCVGSDFPEFSLSDTRSRLDAILVDIPDEKKHNIYYRNIQAFLHL